MSIRNHKWKFVESLVRDAPDTRGVYALWRNEALICIGHAEGGPDTLRARLSDHLNGMAGEESRQATHYSWEICRNPVERETQLLRELGSPRSASESQAQLRSAAVMPFNEAKRSA
jgi:hypothetical protein